MARRFRHFRHKRRGSRARGKTVPREVVSQRASRVIETFFTIIRVDRFAVGWVPRSNPMILILNTRMSKIYASLCKYCIGLVSGEHVVLKIPYWKLAKNKDYYELTTIEGFHCLSEYIWMNTGNGDIMRILREVYPILENRMSALVNENNFKEKVIMRMQQEFFNRAHVVEPLLTQNRGAFARMYFPYSNHIFFRNMTKHIEDFNQAHSSLVTQGEIYVDFQRDVSLPQARPERLRNEHLVKFFKEQAKINTFISMRFGLT
jgi:hypothetical protein